MSLSVPLAVSAAPLASGAASSAGAIIITSAPELIIGSGAAAS
jgi:hypothetical protein